MNRQDVLKTLQGIFRDIFDDDKLIISEDTVPEDIEEWDSIGHTYLKTEIEDEYDIVLDERMQHVRSVKDVVDLIMSVLSNK